mgnify:CR=1 FL=1
MQDQPQFNIGDHVEWALGHESGVIVSFTRDGKAAFVRRSAYRIQAGMPSHTPVRLTKLRLQQETLPHDQH